MKPRQLLQALRRARYQSFDAVSTLCHRYVVDLATSDSA